MKISARNVLKGVVKEIRTGQVMTEVVVGTESGTQIVSVITNDSAKRLELAVGKEVNAIIKATSVMLMAE